MGWSEFVGYLGVLVAFVVLALGALTAYFDW
jgi:hypothetical protein